MPCLVSKKNKKKSLLDGTSRDFNGLGKIKIITIYYISVVIIFFLLASLEMVRACTNRPLDSELDCFYVISPIYQASACI